MSFLYGNALTTILNVLLGSNGSDKVNPTRNCASTSNAPNGKSILSSLLLFIKLIAALHSITSNLFVGINEALLT